MRKLIQLSIMVLSVTLWSSIGSADVKVYDNNGQFLGILILMGGGSVEVFNPTLSAAINLVEGEYVYPFSNPMTYKANDCSGPAYSASSTQNVMSLNDSGTWKYYLPDYSGKTRFVAQSSIEYNGCRQGSWGATERYFYTVHEITLPFTLPAAMPYRFKYIDSEASASRPDLADVLHSLQVLSGRR